MHYKAAYTILLTLFVVLTFIVGFRYGQHVEIVNKKFECISKVTPTSTPAPFEVKNYKDKLCSVDLIYPGNLKLEEATPSGKPLLKFTPK